jgi:hypothetical protein
VCLFAPSAGAGANASNHYHDSPVYFEMFYEAHCDSANLDLLPEGIIHIHPFGIRDVSKFSWVEPEIRAGATEFSWWVRLESLKHMLPFLRSSNEDHRVFLREWFERWYKHHKNLQAPNQAAWECMTTAIRSMVLVYYLKQADRWIPKDESLIAHLREVLRDHQTFLAKEENFDRKSNHGMWEAIGLFELTRVFPDSSYADLALDRMRFIVEKSVSKMGIHKEHAPGYHFSFLLWLHEYTTYLRSLTDLSWASLEKIEEIFQSMVNAAYFMQDHEGNIPTIGDTDESRVAADWLLLKNTSDEDGVYFDKEAGYAIYKDRAKSELQRYIVFNIQNRNPGLPYHFHKDALAVYFNCDGEVILGDQGRYEYGHSPERRYFQSFAAHNTIFPLIYLDLSRGVKQSGTVSRSNLVTDPGAELEGDAVVFTATNSFVKITARRRVVIPKNEFMLKVRDRIVCSALVVLFWNLGADVEEIKQQERPDNDQSRFEWEIRTKKDKKYLLSISINGQSNKDNISMHVIEGSLHPMIGWYAPGYLKKVPSKTIMLQLRPATQLTAKVITQVTRMD